MLSRAARGENRRKNIRGIDFGMASDYYGSLQGSYIPKKVLKEITYKHTANTDE